VPIASFGTAAKQAATRSPVGAGEQCRRHVQANRLRHDQVNDEIELSRPLDRKIGRLRPSKILSTKSAARR
jgi:hypothetical protein